MKINNNKLKNEIQGNGLGENWGTSTLLIELFKALARKRSCQKIDPCIEIYE